MTGRHDITLMEAGRMAGSGYVKTTQTPRTGRNRRPSFTREVVAPVIVFAGTTGAALGGAVLVALHFGDWYKFAGSIALCGAGVAGLITAWIALPHYWSLQWDYNRQELPPREPAPDNGRRRIIHDTGPATKAITRCNWSPGWKPRLARRLHDDNGNWTGGKTPARWMFDKLVSSLTIKYQRGEVQADLRDIGYLNSKDEWTETALTQLGAALRFRHGLDD